MNVGERLLKGRQFDLYEHDPSRDAKWMFQPYTGQGSVEDMREIKKFWNEWNLEEMSIKQEEVKKKMNDLPENIAEQYEKYLPGKKKKKQKNKQ